jgi:hypothetical protein
MCKVQTEIRRENPDEAKIGKEKCLYPSSPGQGANLAQDFARGFG